MQQLTIVGHLGNDAEVKDLGNTQVINFTLAVQEKIKKEKVTT
jgi:single-stranded DNA-binding protein